MHPVDIAYAISETGTPFGSRNVLGDIAISRSYDYHSPLGQSVSDAHWYKKDLQIVATGHRLLNVGVYSSGNQLVSWQALQAEFESPDFKHNFIKDTGLKVSSEQPVTIPTLSAASAYGYRDKTNIIPTKLALPGLHDYLENSGLAYEPFTMSKPSEYGASAGAIVKDLASGLGLMVRMDASLMSYDRLVKFEADDKLTSFEVTTEDGSPAQLDSLRFNITPIAQDRRSADGHWITEFHQDENIIQNPGLVRAARRLSDVVLDLHTVLANAS